MQHLNALATATAPKKIPPLTPFQERTLRALNDTKLGSTHVNEGPPLKGTGFFRATLFAVGIVCLVGGLTLIFFLTALGAGLSLLGGVTCLLAYERGALGQELSAGGHAKARANANAQRVSLH